MSHTVMNLDGISGPTGHCYCDHCQMDNLIDGLTGKQLNFEEEHYDAESIPVYQQTTE